MTKIEDKILSELDVRIRNVQNTFGDENNFPKNQIIRLSMKILECFKSGGKIAFVGNGGSAAEAMHLAAEFTGKCVMDHSPLPVMCLNESQSALTAIANDYGVEKMFSRLVEAHLNSGDILIALSTSGKSLNILEAISKAVEKDIQVVLWTGGKVSKLEKVEIWNVFSESTPRIQEIHLFWGHVIAEIVESNLS